MSTTEKLDQLLNYTDAAELLNMSLGCLYGLVSKRQVPHIRLSKRIVRFNKKELIEFIGSHRILTK